MVVVEYVIDNTPGSHGYTPRDLERSRSLSLPLEKDVLRDALQFEPVSDWARGQFKQFKELSDAVKTHWERASASRARIESCGTRPRPGQKGAGRLHWRPGLTVHCESLKFTGIVYFSQVQGTAVEPKLSLSAWKHMLRTVFWFHHRLEPQEPTVFAEDPPDQAPSLGQQLSGEAKQVEFLSW